ncbi:hypothetical protein QTP88_004646 [Uroleucon formosanum]
MSKCLDIDKFINEGHLRPAYSISSQMKVLINNLKIKHGKNYVTYFLITSTKKRHLRKININYIDDIKLDC